jgi:hypothetical protein
LNCPLQGGAFFVAFDFAFSHFFWIFLGLSLIWLLAFFDLAFWPFLEFLSVY